MRHLQPGPLESTLDIESFVWFRAIQNRLIASDLLGYVIECLDQSQAQFLALLICCDGDVFDVAYES